MGREIKTSRAAQSKHLGCPEALYWATSLQCLSTGFAGRKPEWLEAPFALTRSETTPVPPVSLSTVCTTYSTLPVLQELVGLLPHPESLLPWLEKSELYPSFPVPWGTSPLVSSSFLSHAAPSVQRGGRGMVHAKRCLRSGGVCFTTSLVYFWEMDRERLVLLQGKAAQFLHFKANQDQSRLLIY